MNNQTEQLPILLHFNYGGWQQSFLTRERFAKEIGLYKMMCAAPN